MGGGLCRSASGGGGGGGCGGQCIGVRFRRHHRKVSTAMLVIKMRKGCECCCKRSLGGFGCLLLFSLWSSYLHKACRTDSTFGGAELINSLGLLLSDFETDCHALVNAINKPCDDLSYLGRFIEVFKDAVRNVLVVYMP